jgi:hypothetical protein
MRGLNNTYGAGLTAWIVNYNTHDESFHQLVVLKDATTARAIYSSQLSWEQSFLPPNTILLDSTINATREGNVTYSILVKQLSGGKYENIILVLKNKEFSFIDLTTSSYNASQNMALMLASSNDIP